MDPPLLAYVVAAVAILIPSLYLALVVLSPSPIITQPSEKTFRAHASPTPRPLPSLADKPTLDLSIIIPAYNESARLPTMLTPTLAHLAAHPHRTHELIIVDDGSQDDTSALALALAAQHPAVDIRVVTLERNLGKGGAVRHGMLHARGRRLLMVDADGASRFADLEALWDAMDALVPHDDEDARAVVVGSRAHLVKTAAVVECGFKLFTRRAAQQIFPAQHLATWIFDVELLLLAKQLAIPVAEVPVEWHEVAGSKLNVVRDSLQMLRDLLVLRGNQLVGRWKVTL